MKKLEDLMNSNDRLQENVQNVLEGIRTLSHLCNSMERSVAEQSAEPEKELEHINAVLTGEVDVFNERLRTLNVRYGEMLSD